jgi:hypothetical protein
MDLTDIPCEHEVAETGSALCPLAGFGINDVEPLNSAISLSV